jgi:hypothetical protein
MFRGPTGLSVPHTIAPPDPEIGSAAEREWSLRVEAKLGGWREVRRDKAGVHQRGGPKMLVVVAVSTRPPFMRG